MRIQTLNILCGTLACNARCPFCISKMTYDGGVGPKPATINHRNLQIAIQLAQRTGVTTAMLTGKGEPTLWLDNISSFLSCLKGNFPLIELQTNGLKIGNGDICKACLEDWWSNGLTTIYLSVVHWDSEENREIYTPHKDEYPDLQHTIEKLHNVGLSIRLNCTLMREKIDSWEKVHKLISFAKDCKVEQLTLVPINSFGSNKHASWSENHQLSELSYIDIHSNLEYYGNLLMELAHGALVYDYEGQNVCLSNCLTHESYTDHSLMRNLIFFPDGHLRYDWEYEGAIII